MSNNLEGWWKVIYVAFAFCAALFLGAIKGFFVFPAFIVSSLEVKTFFPYIFSPYKNIKKKVHQNN